MTPTLHDAKYKSDAVKVYKQIKTICDRYETLPSYFFEDLISLHIRDIY